MRKPSVLALALLLVFSAGLVRADVVDLPSRYMPQLDGRLVQLDNPVDGRTWSAWAYRTGAEYDIAISVREAGGLWSEPRIVGPAGDGRNQIQPSLALDAAGNLYLAFVVRETGRVMLSALRIGSQAWSVPVAAPLQAGRFQSPALRVVGDRLVVAARSRTGTVLVDLPLVSPPSGGTHGQNDGPEPFPNQSGGTPLGAR